VTGLVAIVDDEPDIRELVSVQVTKAGFKTKAFAEGKSFLKYIETTVPDVVILDLMLPDIDGIEICKKIKANQRTQHLPVIMLTARVEETDKIIGLELGADDYMTKPFSPKELVARIKAVLRRNVAAKEVVVQLGKHVALSPEKYEILVDGEKIETTTTEFKILHMLAQKKGIVFPREKILDVLWGYEKAVMDRTVDVHVRHLREKLGKYADLIVNVRGVGYKVDW
jgi:two-component system phosphate regulon response regulator PhoB/two-component system alkaline phosphatase synthesis response regulator PhoP